MSTAETKQQFPKTWEVINYQRDFSGNNIEPLVIKNIWYTEVRNNTEENEFFCSFDDGEDKITQVSPKVIKTINHPKAEELKATITQLGSSFYYDIDGDYYDKSWVNNPLEACVEDAEKSLEYIYSGEAARDRAEAYRIDMQERHTLGDY